MKKLLLLLLLLPSLAFSQATGYTLSNFSSSGSIGTAAATVDVYSRININQTTAGIILSVPNPTNTTTKVTEVWIGNIGTVPFTLNHGGVIDTASMVILKWTGSNYTVVGKKPIDGGTVTTISVATANGFSGTVANATTTPAITLTQQNATTSQSGQLTSADWNTFNNKLSTTSADATYIRQDGGSNATTGNVSIGNFRGFNWDGSNYITGSTNLGYVQVRGGTYAQLHGGSYAKVSSANNTNEVLRITNYNGWYSSIFQPNTGNTNITLPATSGTLALQGDVPSGVSATAPITYNNSTGVIAMPAATGSVDGYLSSTKYTDFQSAYTNRITSLTTTGSSGTATLSSNTLNIPNYTLAGLAGTQSANTVYAGPSSGSSTTPTFRSLVVNDLPTIPSTKINGLTNGEIVIGALSGNPISSGISLNQIFDNTNQILTRDISGNITHSTPSARFNLNSVYIYDYTSLTYKAALINTTASTLDIGPNWGTTTIKSPTAFQAPNLYIPDNTSAYVLALTAGNNTGYVKLNQTTQVALLLPTGGNNTGSLGQTTSNEWATVAARQLLSAGGITIRGTSGVTVQSTALAGGNTAATTLTTGDNTGASGSTGDIVMATGNSTNATTTVRTGSFLFNVGTINTTGNRGLYAFNYSSKPAVTYGEGTIVVGNAAAAPSTSPSNSFVMYSNSNSDMAVRTGSTTSVLGVNGLNTTGLQLSYVAKTGSYTITATDYTINCTSGTFTVTLPTAVGIAGKVYVIKNTGVGVITIGTTSSQTIDGSTTSTVASSTTVQSDGANWIIIGKF